ncbi:carbonic anhydrase [Microcoleus sp. FACHB-831]|uniref:carbonic anhydrase n=1 Tax=Microcoleus sp. FACHB-831 TaxID=2692827 RepID=UPI0016883AAC|nr:carbonic anhydrase [Microcoleus sp. FACHB-831]MBD1919703.1 carbonic anhydrase [Microcoleus sp. FACHB-831]
MRKLIKGLHDFQTNYFSENREMFKQLSLKQRPRALFITCSDSRIDPSLITQTKPGELFIMRNVGNIIPPYGSTNGGEGAAIEYAVQALGLKDIILCGHSDCGAMRGLLQLNTLAEDMPLVCDWLKHAEATRRMIKENYKGLEGEELLNVTIEENVITQIENLRTYPAIHSKIHNGQLNLHAWIYKIETGSVFVYSTERCNLPRQPLEYAIYEMDHPHA